ncbi:MAG TPA: SufD family Fe-S cluster assembly protein [Steroidobacteraceae bacterium]|jgi:Fe-S cluster assembly protein SufD
MSVPATAVRSSILERVLHDYESVAADLPGETAARARAAARLSELGWPSVRDEQWRYANLRAFERLNSFRPASAGTLDIALPAAIPGFERLTFLDGVQIGGSHPLQDDSAANHAAASHVWPAEQRLGLLCDMFAHDAARLSVRGEAAIEILFISSDRAAAGAVYPRLQLHLQPGSHLRLIERHLGHAAAPALVACNLTVELGRAAALTHYRLQQYGQGTVFADTLWAHLAEQARYTVRSVAVGAGTARTSALVQLAGRAATLAWQAIAVGRGQQVHDVALKVEHGAADTSTEELFRGIADERARVAFSGHIHIAANAPGSQARQSLRGLIEGAGAEIDLRPRLEILTDEVRAVHGATTGRLDEELLFYMLARGIDRQTARALLKWAFLSDVLREIDVPGLRAEAERLAAGQLQDVLAVGALT